MRIWHDLVGFAHLVESIAKTHGRTNFLVDAAPLRKRIRFNSTHTPHYGSTIRSELVSPPSRSAITDVCHAKDLLRRDKFLPLAVRQYAASGFNFLAYDGVVFISPFYVVVVFSRIGILKVG